MKKGWRKVKLEKVLKFYNGKAIKPEGQSRYPVYGANGIIGYSDMIAIMDRIRMYMCPKKQFKDSMQG